MNIKTIASRMYIINRAVREPSSPNQRLEPDDSVCAKFLSCACMARCGHLTQYVCLNVYLILIGGEEITMVFIHHLERTATTPGHAGERVVRHEYRQTRFFGNQAVQTF